MGQMDAHVLSENVNILNSLCKPSWLWMMKGILQQVNLISAIQHIWNAMLQSNHFQMKSIYRGLLEDNIRVHWRFLLKQNSTRPRACVTLWFLCKRKLATKERLRCFGIIQGSCCSLCSEAEETVDHLFFDWRVTKDIRKAVLLWLELDHNPSKWSHEIQWVVANTKKKA